MHGLWVQSGPATILSSVYFLFFVSYLFIHLLTQLSVLRIYYAPGTVLGVGICNKQDWLHNLWGEYR